jgi:hypothetical protein
MWSAHYAERISDGIIEAAIAVEAETVFQMLTAVVGWPSIVVGDGDLLSALM